MALYMCLTKKKPILVLAILCFLITLLLFIWPLRVSAAETTGDVGLPSINITVGEAGTPEEVNRSLQILFLLTLVTLSPYLLVMLTSFTRITISLHFLRSAMGTQQMPPNQILIGLALFLTLFMMGPQLTRINEEALQPYNRGELTQSEALRAGMLPLREFMLAQVTVKDLDLFSELAQLRPGDYGSYEEIAEELPYSVLIPAFLVGEITKGFEIGVILYIPFIVIDMVIASTLMAMGMMMLPPAMISLPFKILFFVMVDGWEIVIQGVLLTFR